MKTKIRISLWTLIGLFLFSISGVFAQKSVELQYNLNKGDKYLFITDIDMDMTFDARGTTTTMNSVMGIQMTSLINIEVTP